MTSLARYLSTAGKTQRWLAARVGVRPATVCAWCSGASTPRPEHMIRIEQATEGEVPVSDWFQLERENAA